MWDVLMGHEPRKIAETVREIVIIVNITGC
jgi:hypothetical protein